MKCQLWNLISVSYKSFATFFQYIPHISLSSFKEIYFFLRDTVKKRDKWIDWWKYWLRLKTTEGDSKRFAFIILPECSYSPRRFNAIGLNAFAISRSIKQTPFIHTNRRKYRRCWKVQILWWKFFLLDLCNIFPFNVLNSCCYCTWLYLVFQFSLIFKHEKIVFLSLSRI